MDNKTIWQAVLGELEVNLSKANFTTWLKNTAILSNEDGNIVIVVPNIFTKEWLENKYNSQIQAALRRTVGDITKVSYKVGSVKNIENEVEKNINSPANQGTADQSNEDLSSFSEPRPTNKGSLNPKYVFDTFIVGESNKLAFAACQAVAKNPGDHYNPLFIYGGVGLGKTHLMQAIGNSIKKTDSKKTVLYVSSEKFTNDFIGAIQNKKTGEFKNKYRKVDVLMIDDMQFIAGKEQTQQEFFHTFNQLHQNNKQIIIASDRPPKAIPTLEERLRSRFEWGLMVDVQPPDLETRIAILQKKALLKGWNFPLETIDYISRNIQQNVRELEGALNRVIAFCELTATKPTLEVTKQVLGNILSSSKKRSVSAKQIIENTANFYDIKIEEIMGKKRDREIVVPRQIAMYLLREELNLSYPKIAKELNKKDHTTAIHACDKIEKEIDGNEPLRHEISLIKERLYI